MPYFFRYITEDGANAIKRYKYAGSDASIMYSFTSPYLYNPLVTFYPKWLAPNLITLTGLLMTVSSHLFLMFHCPDLKCSESTPRWIFAWNGAAVLLYQTLDATDGKQARRTNSSSPLGLLFDHGCDALNTTVMAISLMTLSNMGPTWKTLIFWMMNAVGFFGATWEEYYTGELHLPIINGPNEGLLVMAIFSFITAYTGPAFWELNLNEVLPFDLPVAGTVPMNEAMLWLFVPSFVFSMAVNFFNVAKVIRSRKKTKVTTRQLSVAQQESTSNRVALTRFLPLIALIVLVSNWVYISPSNILERHPRMVLWIYGIGVCKLVTGIMVAHICDQELHPFSRTIGIVIMLLVHATLLHNTDNLGRIGIKLGKDLNEDAPEVLTDEKHKGYHEDLLLIEILTLLSLSYAHFAWQITREMCSILGIYCFVITAKPLPRDDLFPKQVSMPATDARRASPRRKDT